jgi:hypothetical protein
MFSHNQRFVVYEAFAFDVKLTIVKYEILLGLILF